MLLFLSPFLAKQALKFGPPEYFMLAVLGMSTVIGMAGKNIVKNILAMAVGLIFSCVGMSPQTGLARFTFGQVSLMDGISLIPMLIGLFGITSILEMIESIRCLLYTSFDAHFRDVHRVIAEFGNVHTAEIGGQAAGLLGCGFHEWDLLICLVYRKKMGLMVV